MKQFRSNYCLTCSRYYECTTGQTIKDNLESLKIISNATCTDYIEYGA